MTGAAFVLILLFLEVKHTKTSFSVGMRAIDWFGMFTFISFTLLILLGLDFGGKTFPWNSPKVIVLIAVGSVILPAFIYSEMKLAKYPIIPLGVFKDRSNLATLLVSFSHGLVRSKEKIYLSEKSNYLADIHVD